MDVERSTQIESQQQKLSYRNQLRLFHISTKPSQQIGCVWLKVALEFHLNSVFDGTKQLLRVTKKNYEGSMEYKASIETDKLTYLCIGENNCLMNHLNGSL